MSVASEFSHYITTAAEAFGVPLYRVLHAPRSQGVTEVRRAVYVILREKGYSYPEIGSAAGCHHTSVMRLLGKCGATKSAPKVARARKAAKKIVESARLSPTPMDLTADGPTAYAEALERYRAGKSELRWAEYLRRQFPHSWERQLAQPPRGLDA